MKTFLILFFASHFIQFTEDICEIQPIKNLQRYTDWHTCIYTLLVSVKSELRLFFHKSIFLLKFYNVTNIRYYIQIIHSLHIKFKKKTSFINEINILKLINETIENSILNKNTFIFLLYCKMRIVSHEK